jgi:hypothetical protein
MTILNFSGKLFVLNFRAGLSSRFFFALILSPPSLFHENNDNNYAYWTLCSSFFYIKSIRLLWITVVSAYAYQQRFMFLKMTATSAAILLVSYITDIINIYYLSVSKAVMILFVTWACTLQFLLSCFFMKRLRRITLADRCHSISTRNRRETGRYAYQRSHYDKEKLQPT